MATCPRCRTHELALESVGVFRCAACGRVNADGEPIAEGATEATRFVVQSGVSSFAAPPPALTATAGTRVPLPRRVALLIATQAIVSILATAAEGSDSAMRLVFRGAVLGGLVIGDRAAYRAACFSWMAVLVSDAYVTTTWWPLVPPVVRAFFVVVAVLDAAFLAALLSPDVRRHYERATSP